MASRQSSGAPRGGLRRDALITATAGRGGSGRLERSARRFPTDGASRTNGPCILEHSGGQQCILERSRAYHRSAKVNLVP